MVFERIREIICDQLDDLVMSIEDEFGLEVPDDQIENFRTVGDVVRYIEENS